MLKPSVCICVLAGDNLLVIFGIGIWMVVNDSSCICLMVAETNTDHTASTHNAYSEMWPREKILHAA